MKKSLVTGDLDQCCSKFTSLLSEFLLCNLFPFAPFSSQLTLFALRPASCCWKAASDPSNSIRDIIKWLREDQSVLQSTYIFNFSTHTIKNSNGTMFASRRLVIEDKPPLVKEDLLDESVAVKLCWVWWQIWVFHKEDLEFRRSGSSISSSMRMCTKRPSPKWCLVNQLLNYYITI